MICQEMLWNGQQKPVSAEALLAWLMEGITARTMAILTVTLAFVTSTVRLTPAVSVPSAHFYM